MTQIDKLTVDRGHICGGSIITEWHVLTAAHCEPFTNDTYVIVGEHNLEDDVNEGGQRIPVAEYYLYNNGMDLMSWMNDIAILRLAKKIILGDHVGLVEWRDSPSARYEGEVATVIGWGRISTTHEVTVWCYMGTFTGLKGGLQS